MVWTAVVTGNSRGIPSLPIAHPASLSVQPIIVTLDRLSQRVARHLSHGCRTVLFRTVRFVKLRLELPVRCLGLRSTHFPCNAISDPKSFGAAASTDFDYVQQTDRAAPRPPADRDSEALAIGKLTVRRRPRSCLVVHIVAREAWSLLPLSTGTLRPSQNLT